MGVDYHGWEPKHPFSILTDIARWWLVEEDDVAASPQYIGLVDKEGNWLIMKETSAAGLYSTRYATGRSGFVAAWIARAGLTYRYPYEEI